MEWIGFSVGLGTGVSVAVKVGVKVKILVDVANGVSGVFVANVICSGGEVGLGAINCPDPVHAARVETRTSNMVVINPVFFFINKIFLVRKRQNMIKMIIKLLIIIHRNNYFGIDLLWIPDQDAATILN